jgi:hypothetical protein
MKEKNIEAGRKHYDFLMSNLSWIASRTDDELAAKIQTEAEMFGEKKHPEDVRQEARALQDKITALGREAFASEYEVNP